MIRDGLFFSSTFDQNGDVFTWGCFDLLLITVWQSKPCIYLNFQLCQIGGSLLLC